MTSGILQEVSENNLVPATDSKTAQVAIIGRDDGRTFRDLLTMLRQSNQMRIGAEYATLSAALEAGLGKPFSADFVIVIQSCSDEFDQHEINELIGRMLFSRILCCYGPWCTADGRSHELWPVACRVPAASAVSLVELELREFHANAHPLFPMSAGEEVFAHRSQFSGVTEAGDRGRAIVISDDFVLRSTVSGILAALGCQCTVLPTTATAIRRHAASYQFDSELAIIDLDGPECNVEECLNAIHNENRITDVAGMSVFTAFRADSATTPSPRPTHLIEKTELLLQLRRLLALLRK